jgi:hypothetical protein
MGKKKLSERGAEPLYKIYKGKYEVRVSKACS